MRCSSVVKKIGVLKRCIIKVRSGSVALGCFLDLEFMTIHVYYMKMILKVGIFSFQRCALALSAIIVKPSKELFRFFIERNSWKSNKRPKGPWLCTSLWNGTHADNGPAPKKRKIGREGWVLPSCQVSLNSVQRLQTKNLSCLSQSEAMAAMLVFQSAQKHELCRGRWELTSVQRLQMSSQNCISQSEASSAILFLRCFGMKNTNLVEVVEIIPHVMFIWIVEKK